MFLYRLELQGFKSFVEKTNVFFSDGITGVIGPNGCGKTNVSDAIRWVMGEQSAKQLRGDSMEDVIFNGCPTRKPLGMAEVHVTFKNDRGILPTEFSEVTISRRVFRSGVSEYLLNKTPCRLRDIRDLFFDTGMGSHAYSVIERAMVDNILSDTTGHCRVRSPSVASSLCSASFLRCLYFVIPDASSNRKRRWPALSERMWSTIERSMTE